MCVGETRCWGWTCNDTCEQCTVCEKVRETYIWSNKLEGILRHYLRDNNESKTWTSVTLRLCNSLKRFKGVAPYSLGPKPRIICN